MTKHKHHNSKHDEPAGGPQSHPDRQDPPPTEESAQESTPAAESGIPVASAPDPLLSEKKAMEDRYMRLMADFDNFRRRTMREKSEIARMANETFLLELLPVMDHLDLALGAADANQPKDAVVKGFRMVADQLAAFARRFGVEPVDAEGCSFDTAVHEAITHMPSDSVPENAVIKQVRRGYRLGTKLIRPAQVIVSSGPVQRTDPAAAVLPTADVPPSPTEDKRGKEV